MHSLIDLHTFHLPAQAANVLYLDDKAQLSTVDWLQPYLVLGEGSNQVFVADYQGTLIINRLAGKQLHEEDDHYLLSVAGGESWHALVVWLCQQGIGGLENLALIPGTVGASPIQNIGAYGAELADYCQHIEYFDPNDGQLYQIAASDCAFGYRDSVFKHRLRHVLITEVSFCLPKHWQAKTAYGELKQLAQQQALTPQLVMEKVCEVRALKLPDPKVLGNAGSFFKNPIISEQQFSALHLAYPEMPHYSAPAGIKLAAGWLIDQCNLKGYRIGDAAVHEAQALVLVNHAHATAGQLLALAKHVVQTVEQRFGISLEPEVRFIGADGEISFAQALQHYG